MPVLHLDCVFRTLYYLPVCVCVFQGLVVFNSSDLSDAVELRPNMAELLNRSVLYVEPVDPVYWFGAVLKCEGRILPCLQVQQHTCH